MTGILVVFCALLTSCQLTPQPAASDEKATSIDATEDFETFYQRFHEDSVYQMAHISFPLAGLPVNADTLEDPQAFRWSEESWRIHKPFEIRNTDFDQQLQQLGDDIIIETIISRSTKIGMVRRFAKSDNDWMLIYYAAMNPMGEDH